MQPDKETIFLLYEAHQKFCTAGSSPELYTGLVEMLKKSLGVDLVSIWFLNEPEMVLTCELAEGFGKEFLEKKSVELERGLLGELVQSQKELWVNAEDDPEDFILKFTREWGIKASFLGWVPLSTREEIFGGVLLSHHNPFQEDKKTRNINFVKKLASSVALALENLHNRETLAKRIRDLTTLSEVGAELSSSLDLGKVLKTLLYNIMGHFIVEHIAILLKVEKEDCLSLVEYHGLPQEVSNLDFSCERELAQALGQIKAPIFKDNLQEDLLTLDEQNRLEMLKAYLLVPILVKDELIGLITLGEKLTHEPFDENEIEFISTIANQAGIAIKNANLFQTERKARELSLLLEISKEITSTLDLDRVLKAFVNLSSQVIEYDRAVVGLFRGDNLKVNAISGEEKVDRKTEKILVLEKLLSWVSEGKSPIYVSSLEGEIQAENEEIKNRIKEYFQLSQMKSFLAVPLIDEEGTLGVMSMESQAPSFLAESNLEVIEILSNQLTVAIRNAELYQQIPLKKVIQPLIEKKRALFKMPGRRLKAIAISAVLVLILLVFWKSELKVSCPVEIWPQRTYTLTAEVEGILQEVLVREGQEVKPGQRLAKLYNQDIQSRLNEVQVLLKTAQGNARNLFSANRISQYQIDKGQVKKLEAELSLLKALEEKTKITSPISGTVLTPRLEEKVGEFLLKGDFFCQVANLKEIRAEIQFPGKDIDLANENQKIKLLLDAFPQKTFWGVVEKVSSSANFEQDNKTFLVIARIENFEELLRPGMTGQVKVYCGKKSLAYIILRKPTRFLRALAWRVFGF